MAQRKVVDQIRDLVERVAWTFLEAEVSLGLLDWVSQGYSLKLWHQIVASLGAATAATIKVLIAQRVGKHNDGAAIPGGVIRSSD